MPAGLTAKFDPKGVRNTDVRMAETWPVERALKLYDYFKEEAEKGTILEFEGHASCWATMALCARLPKNQVKLYMPPFRKSLDLAPFQISEKLTDGQMCDYRIREEGDDIYLEVVLSGDGNPDPFAVAFADTTAPALPAGKNIYVNLYGNHYLPCFCLPWTYPDCKTMYMCTPVETHCVLSNDPNVKVGDEGKNPFKED